MRDVVLHNEDCQVGIQSLEDNSIQCIYIDPPYGYLKHKLERPFNEVEFFKQCHRVLKPDGFITLFGRGTSFYRWNLALDEVGFRFLEEIVWDKRNTSSPVHPVGRIHELATVYTKGKGKLNRVKVPYLEQKDGNIKGIVQDVKRLKSALNNPTSLDYLQSYLEDGMRKDYQRKGIVREKVTMQTKPIGERATYTMVAIEEGMLERTIMSVLRETYKRIHPTQKPVRLAERLLALTTQEGDTVADFFAGSASTGIACMNTRRKFMGWEIDPEYYEAAQNRIESHAREEV